MAYKQFGYYETLPVDPNEIKVYDNNFSILVKYHFPTKSKINVSLASGWTYTIRQNDYYYFEDNGTTKHWFPNITSYSDYTIPFLAEIGYPISKKIDIQARMKYNFNYQNGSTYSGGLGLSLQL